MQAVTDQFKAAVNAATRHLDVMLTVLNRSGTERVYTSNDALLSLKIVDGKTTGGFGLGGTICPSLTAELHKSAVVAVNDKITVQIVVKDGGNLTLASEFSVDDIKRRPDGTMQVTALGLMIKLGKNHVSSITYPATQYQLLSEIAARAGRQLHPTLESRLINNPTIKSAPLKGKAEDGTTLYYTRRELLGYAAAINGGSAIIDQYGYLDIVRYTDTGEVIGADRAFREDITDSYEITDIAWNTTGLSYALDDDFDNGMVEFYNPLNYADSERDTIISNLDSELVGFGYEGAIIQKQGCGYYQVGDVVTYKDIGSTNHTLLIMGIVYSFSDGYFTETLYSLASSENRRQYAGNEVVSNQIGGGQAQPITPSAVTEYEYISDTSVKCNGVTYSVEKNDTGLISKISDNCGNEFEPTISGEISDVALHNAVFWAVAMARGLKATVSEHDFIIASIDAVSQVKDYDYYYYFIHNQTYSAGKINNYKLGIGTKMFKRGFWNTTYWLGGVDAAECYEDIPRFTNVPANVKIYDNGCGIRAFEPTSITMYISGAPSSQMAFYDGWFEAGKPLDITQHRPQPRDVFVFRDLKSTPTGVFAYQWNDIVFIHYQYDGTSMIMDDTNARLVRGVEGGFDLYDITDYLPTTDDTTFSFTAKEIISKEADPSPYGTSYYSTLRNNLDLIYWNSEDIYDENGNLLLKKNCDVDMWL